MHSSPVENRGDRVWLRPVEDSDLETLFVQQDDAEANRLAGVPARGREAFLLHWRSNVLGDSRVHPRAVMLDHRLAGHVLCFPRDGRTMFGYWLGREFWGRRIASQAVPQFLTQVPVRPLYASVAAHNTASIRVLERSGFRRVGSGRDADDQSISEHHYLLP